MKCTLDINERQSIITKEYNVTSGRDCRDQALSVLEKDNGRVEVQSVMYKTTDDSGATRPEGSGVLAYSEGGVKGISLTGSTFSGGPMVKTPRSP
jgi:hypothetical protein